jgi:hypothetical protein
MIGSSCALGICYPFMYWKFHRERPYSCGYEGLGLKSDLCGLQASIYLHWNYMFYFLEELDETPLAETIPGNRLKKFFPRDQRWPDRAEQLEFERARQTATAEKQARSSNPTRLRELLGMVEDEQNLRNIEENSLSLSIACLLKWLGLVCFQAITTATTRYRIKMMAVRSISKTTAVIIGRILNSEAAIAAFKCCSITACS